MSVWRLILQEIAHRKLNALLALLSVAVAVGCFVGAVTLLQADELTAKEAGKQLEDEMRKITKGLGFNIVVLPEQEDLQQFTLTGIPQESMPESLVAKLAESEIVTVNHLLPVVTRRMEWPETKKEIILTGTRGEVPLAHRALKKPLQDQVPAGTMILGYQLGRQLELKAGDTTTLMEREFKVSKVREELGDQQDSTVWVNLKEAQEMLGMQNMVSAILALECNCQTVDRVAEIRADIAGILPGTKVIERGSKALARAEARNNAKKVADEKLEQHEHMASIMLPLVLLSCGVWIGFLSMLNVRQRTTEVGILRALGLTSTQVVWLFLGKAIALGLIGALVGYAIALAVTVPFATIPTELASSALILPWVFGAAIVLAPCLSAIASWVPSLLAARQDPAVVLQGD